MVAGAIALDTTFDANKKHTHDLRSNAPLSVEASRFRERVEGIRVRLSAVGLATKVTIKVTLDAAGDDIVVPDTEATIATGVTTATKGAVAFAVKLPVYQSASGEVGKLYVFVKADAACTVDQTTLTWTET
ncbi:MAG: hypothetical protein GY872_19185 [Roseibacillus sp.]|nr:hypothetical protein [Roseibacillus sp.]